MSDKVLDRLRLVMQFERSEGPGVAPEARARVFVTPSGKVVIGDQVADGEERMLSRVHPAVFA